MTTDVEGTRRRIIPRPRLTRLLDESTARIKLLVAPAGYGKTTLALEWLEAPERRDVWYRGGPASADVAALAAGLAKAMSSVVAGAGKRTGERLRATGHPEEDVDLLAELFAEDLETWPADTWVVIDDYHFVMDSTASERFFDVLANRTPLQLLITTRRRPSWATARRILYGEIQEIDHRALAMSDREGAEVLDRSPDEVRQLLEDARGWPAIIGLVALTGGKAIGGHQLSALEEFFADELLSSLRPEELDAVSALALTSGFTSDAATAVLGEEDAAAIHSAVRLGIVASTVSGTYAVHPLLRRFLTRRTNELSSDRLSGHAGRLIDFYLAERRWDDAFELARNHSGGVRIPRVVGEALDGLLSEGRIATLSRWLDCAYEFHLDDPLLDLAEAELAFRLSDHARAEQLALKASRELTEPSLVARSLVRAGYAAVLASREQHALGYFRHARQLATGTMAKREALLGEYYAASELGDPSAPEVLEAAYALEDASPEGRLRIEVMRLTRANRHGGLSMAIAEAATGLHLVGRVRDPLVATAFLHALSTALNLAGRYEQALDSANRLVKEAERFGLTLPIPHAKLDIAVAQLGLKRFDSALANLSLVEKSANRSDPYLEALAVLARARLYLIQQRADAALVELAPINRNLLSPPARSELAAIRALALTKLERFDAARMAIKDARPDLETSVEARVLVAGVEALCERTRSDRRAVAAGRLWELSRTTGNVDSFVCIYRTAPEILLDVAGFENRKEILVSLLDRLGDIRLAERLRLYIGPPNQTLTVREREVSELLLDGLSNREIATQLFISLATVKVHLRHIYEKLGVRNRASAITKLR